MLNYRWVLPVCSGNWTLNVDSFQENDASVRLKIASLLGLLSKTAGFSPDCIMDDAINTLQNESKSHFLGGA